MYGLLVLAGILALLSPSELVQNQVGGFVVFIWSSFLVVGAASCLYGAITDKWIGEYSGLWNVMATLALYGLSAIAGAGLHLSPLFAYGLVVVGFSAGLLARGFDVRDEKKRSEEEELTEETEE